MCNWKTLWAYMIKHGKSCKMVCVVPEKSWKSREIHWPEIVGNLYAKWPMLGVIQMELFHSRRLAYCHQNKSWPISGKSVTQPSYCKEIRWSGLQAIVWSDRSPSSIPVGFKGFVHIGTLCLGAAQWFDINSSSTSATANRAAVVSRGMKWDCHDVTDPYMA